MSEKEARESTPSRWDPFADLRRWRPLREGGWPRQLADLLGEPFEDWPVAGAFQPALDVHEDPERYTVTVELPAVKKDDVTVEVHDNVLVLRGEKRSEREEEKEHARYVERRYGSFRRSFSLPADAQADRIQASFGDGVLTLTIPRSGETKPRTIAIKS